VVGNSPRQERSERTRAHIIQTAASAFAEHGFDGVSLNDLVAASGLSKGAFYFHFASKEEIALAAFRAKQQEMLRLLAAEQVPTKAADRLELGLRRRAQLLRKDPSFGCITRLGSRFNERSSPGSEYASFLDLARRAIAELVADGQRRGEFRKDLDPEAAARAIFAAVVGVDTLSHLSSRGKDFEDRIDELIDVLLHGLLKPDD
jgi:AcrR family transcriptional regulator